MKVVVVNAGSSSLKYQLFDMENDRGEMRNLAVENKFQDILREHRALLENWLKTHPGPDRQRHLRFIPE